MDELVKLVVEKTGISEELAQKAVDIVLDYLKDKLPEPIAGRLDDVLDGVDAGDLMKGLGSLFGG